MLADGYAALVAGLLDVQKMSTVWMSTNHLDRDSLARQRIGNVDRSIVRFGDAISPMPEPHDVEFLSHGSLRAETRRFRRHPRWERG